MASSTKLPAHLSLPTTSFHNREMDESWTSTFGTRVLVGFFFVFYEWTCFTQVMCWRNPERDRWMNFKVLFTLSAIFFGLLVTTLAMDSRYEESLFGANSGIYAAMKLEFS